MKAFYFLIFSILLARCDSHLKKDNHNDVNATQNLIIAQNQDTTNTLPDNTDTIQLQKSIVLTEIREFPKITDKKLLMEKLRKIINAPDITNVRLPVSEILNYRKFNIDGSDARLVLLEYRFAHEEDAPLSIFPYKCQFIFKEDGTLLHTLSDIKYRFVKIFPDRKPFLITVSSTARGNGIHSVYKYQNDSLVNIFDYDHSYIPKTYDAINCESIANIPAELKMTIKDYNKDGFNDLIFTGALIYDNMNGCVSEHYEAKQKVKLIFQYNQQHDKFSPLQTFTTIEDLFAK